MNFFVEKRACLTLMSTFLISQRVYLDDCSKHVIVYMQDFVRFFFKFLLHLFSFFSSFFKWVNSIITLNWILLFFMLLHFNLFPGLENQK